jgi:hypothetical protein
MKESIAVLHTAPQAMSIDRRVADLTRVKWNLFPLADISCLLRRDKDWKG